MRYIEPAGGLVLVLLLLFVIAEVGMGLWHLAQAIREAWMLRDGGPYDATRD